MVIVMNPNAAEEENESVMKSIRGLHFDVIVLRIDAGAFRHYRPAGEDLCSVLGGNAFRGKIVPVSQPFLCWPAGISKMRKPHLKLGA